MNAAFPINAQSKPSEARPISAAATGSVPVLSRAEALIELALAVSAYRSVGGTWLLFALLFLAPDVTMVGYLANPRVGARVYNGGPHLSRTSAPCTGWLYDGHSAGVLAGLDLGCSHWIRPFIALWTEISGRLWCDPLGLEGTTQLCHWFRAVRMAAFSRSKAQAGHSAFGQTCAFRFAPMTVVCGHLTLCRIRTFDKSGNSVLIAARRASPCCEPTFAARR
jgi:hypothetical protein